MVSAASADTDVFVVEVCGDRSNEWMLTRACFVMQVRKPLLASMIQHASMSEGKPCGALEVFELELPAPLWGFDDPDVSEVIPEDALASSSWTGVETAQLEMVVVNVELQHATTE